MPKCFTGKCEAEPVCNISWIITLEEGLTRTYQNACQLHGTELWKELSSYPSTSHTVIISEPREVASENISLNPSEDPTK